MTTHVIVRKDSYHDSVLLMRISRELKSQDGVEDAVVAMGTPVNRELLRAQGYATREIERAGPNDLILAVKLAKGEPNRIEAVVDGLLSARDEAAAAEVRPTSLTQAVRDFPDTNLVLISVPGEHAARQARRALALGRHVMLFSDNVSLEDEVSLKNDAAARGLLMMGPDCGTAILNGKPLAFANVVRRGSIGIVGAAGTGIQEVSCCIHRLGGGVSQAIGTGGRDLSDAVGGTMMLLGLSALTRDPKTTILVVISKPPSEQVARKIVDTLAASPKKSVVHFVGAPPRPPTADGRVVFADSLASTAEVACRLAGIEVPESPVAPASVTADLAAKLHPGATLKGLFCGGTTGHEALTLLSRTVPVRSNLHKKGDLRVDGAKPVNGHVLLDLGDDLFTQGRPHPMIEPALRNERLALEMSDPNTGLILADVVLGFGSHADPAGLLAQGISDARKVAAGRKRSLVAIASVTGTPDDPQGYDRQRQVLQDAGIIVASDNRQAALQTAAVLGRIRKS